MSNLMATGQVEFGDSVYVDVDASGKLLFSKRSDPALSDELQRVLEETEQSDRCCRRGDASVGERKDRRQEIGVRWFRRMVLLICSSIFETTEILLAGKL